MAKMTWKVSEPQPNPFEATTGDFREYIVHLCTVFDAGWPEIPGILVEFFRQAFGAALEIGSPEARRVLIEVDTVYAMVTVVLTDDGRSFDERDVFKLSMNDWAEGGADSQREMDDFESAIRAALGDLSLSNIQAELRARHYRIWIFDLDQEETLKEIPLAGV